MHEMLLLWSFIFFCALFAELQNPGLFYFLSLSIGSCGALGAYALGSSQFWQLIIFFTTSVLALLFLQLVVRTHRSNGVHHKTNVEALAGKRGLVLEDIVSAGVGQVKIEGEIWSARALHNTHILVNTVVEVKSVVGCHLIVQPVKQ